MALVLVILVLMSSLGVPLHKRICLMKGEQTVAFFDLHLLGCCNKNPKKSHCHAAVQPCKLVAERAKISTSGKKCCEFTVDLLKVDLKTAAFDNLSNMSIGWTWVGQMFDYLGWTPYNRHSQIKYFYTNNSPPSTGRDIIILHQSFLI